MGGEKRSGYLLGCRAKTMKDVFSRQIYTVPFNHDIENDQQECYFRYMELMPCARHIRIENQAGEEFLFQIRGRKVLPFNGLRVEYHFKYLGILNRIKYFFLDLWDDLRGKEY